MAHRQIIDGQDWMRDQERRTRALERRPGVPNADALLGPSIGPQAVQIVDWNDPNSLLNGWVWCDRFANNSPDPNQIFTGMITSVAPGIGHQEAWTHSDTIPPVRYARAWTRDPITGVYSFTAWGGGVSNQFLGSLEFSNVLGVGSYFNTGTWVNTAYPGAQALPAGTRTVNVVFQSYGRAASNAACFWRMGVDYGPGGALIGPSNWRVHNQGDQYVNMGINMAGWASAVGKTTIRPYADINIDTGGVGLFLHTGNFMVHCFA